MSSTITTGTYSTTSLARALAAFEARFGMTSAEFFSRHAEWDAELPVGLTGYIRHTWASYYSEWLELTGETLVSDGHDPLATQIERELQVA